jgi:hypothetical protein
VGLKRHHLGPDARARSGRSKLKPLVEGIIGAWAATHSSRHTRQEPVGALARDAGSALALRDREVALSAETATAGCIARAAAHSSRHARQDATGSEAWRAIENAAGFGRSTCWPDRRTPTSARINAAKIRSAAAPRQSQAAVVAVVV